MNEKINGSTPPEASNYGFIFLMAGIELLLMLAIFYGERTWFKKPLQNYEQA
jgi:hypothetical protein